MGSVAAAVDEQMQSSLHFLPSSVSSAVFVECCSRHAKANGVCEERDATGDDGVNYSLAFLTCSLQVNNMPANPQGAGWSDRFNVSIVGRELTVWRVDGPQQWGQELKLAYAPAPAP